MNIDAIECFDPYEKPTKEDKAKALGLEIRKPAPDELFVDLDSEEDFLRFVDLLKMATKRARGVFSGHVDADPLGTALPSFVTVTPSKGGLPRRHVVVKLAKPVESEMERIGLQAILGSDRKREIMSFCEWKTGSDKDPVVFFEKSTGAEAAIANLESSGYDVAY